MKYTNWQMDDSGEYPVLTATVRLTGDDIFDQALTEYGERAFRSIFEIFINKLLKTRYLIQPLDIEQFGQFQDSLVPTSEQEVGNQHLYWTVIAINEVWNRRPRSYHNETSWSCGAEWYRIEEYMRKMGWESTYRAMLFRACQYAMYVPEKEGIE